ncbi:uncharacterized protein BX663DRAFT_504674 [Cokeromyces recurvatus]|uniref:uncharacterized protein n=1 Tax=Cokeromyces recurvatus TaxID=90255 RepID=UPI00221F363B|nr:uncharacterized protein BX663DRAFT_504674 [Cokeromyces recurvatus]KAI7904322.1 hypothetical protein BX663DRAFT_504674 [Cokeromyces recurvatus]
MSSRLAKQSLDLLLSTTKKSDTQFNDKKAVKVKLPKTNKGVKKAKYEIRYGRHQKTKALKEKLEKRENPVDKLNEIELSIDEKLKRNVQIMQRALRSSPLEKKIYKKIIKEKNARKTKKWSNKVHGSDQDTDEDSD